MLGWDCMVTITVPCHGVLVISLAYWPLAAHQEKDRVQDSAFDFQMHARMCPSILEGIFS